MKVGQRVELHPAMDAWMKGDRFGEVVKTGYRRSGAPFSTVLMDRSGRHLRVDDSMLTAVS